jgi:hypothetical protein
MHRELIAHASNSQMMNAAPAKKAQLMALTK